MIFTEELRWTIFPDKHAQYDRFARAVEYHDPHTDVYGILGDFIDGPENKKTIDFIRSLGARAVAITGNHEWVLRNALSIADRAASMMWADEVWPKYEKNVLKNYGLLAGSALIGWVAKAQQLRQVLQEDGTLAWLDSLPSYIETPTFVGVHSGPRLDVPWHIQRMQLEQASSPDARLYEEPDQIFSQALSGVETVPIEVDHRIFISGHRHIIGSTEQRRAPGRICLASPLDRGAPLYTWTSEDDVIHEHAA